MKKFTTVELNRATGQVLGEAQADIVCITRYNKPAFYVVNAGDWKRYLEAAAQAAGLVGDE